jgi:hypothetical protein
MSYIVKIIKKIKNKELFEYISWKLKISKYISKKNKKEYKNYFSEKDFRIKNNLDIKKIMNDNYAYDGNLLDIIYKKDNKKLIHKWLHYFPIYEKYFSKFVDKSVYFLEIGVYKGGSLQMFNKYFGNKTTIYGIDIDENCMKFNGEDGQVRIGNQSDIKFLDSVLEEMKYLDIVLDDGSHKMSDIKNSFIYIFPQLRDGGIYMIEDLHTSYWDNYEGGFDNKNNFYNFLRELIDDMHHWYHENNQKYSEISNFISSIHIYDSVVIFEKKLVSKPKSVIFN